MVNGPVGDGGRSTPMKSSPSPGSGKMPASPARVAELKASVSAKKAEAQQKQQELVQIRAAKDAMAQELYDLRRPKSSGGSLKIRPKISMPTSIAGTLIACSAGESTTSMPRSRVGTCTPNWSSRV